MAENNAKNNARIALFTHLKNNWTQTPIVFGEDDPAGDLYMKNGTPFLYVYISWGNEIMRSMISSNQAIYDTIGVLAFRLYTKIEDGAATTDILSDRLFAVWRSKKIDNISIEKMSVDHDSDGTGKSKIWHTRFLSIGFIVRSLNSF